MLIMNRLCVVVVVVCVTSIAYSEIIKCCNSYHSFKKINGTFKCSDYPSYNSHIFTNNTNFLQNNTEGQCVEFFKDFYIFNISNSGISQFQIVDEKKVYSKCCPLNFVYNTLTHGCEEIENANYLNIKEIFLKVGLPKCEVLVDEIVENITEQFNNNDSSCVDRTTNGSFILRKCKESNGICSEMRCVQKCCPDGQIFLNKRRNGTCIEGYRGINLTEFTIRGASEFPEDPFATVITNKFIDRYFIDELQNPSYLNRKGIFSYTYNESRTRNVTSSDYCVEYIKTLRGYTFWYNEYNRNPNTETDYQDYYPYILPISVILLAITIIIYFLLNEVEKMFGKILVNYCLALLIWEGILAYGHLVSSSFYGNTCVAIAFSVIFTRNSVFVWSNSLSWHTWRTFGSMTRINETGRRKKKQYKEILLYSLYGWGIPAILTSTIFLFYIYNDILPKVIQPIVGVSGCYFELVPGNHSQLLFLDIPIMLMQVVNIVLFVKTTMYCLKVKKEINKMADNADKMEQFKRNKAKLYLVLKLIIIMGVTFISQAILNTVPLATDPVLHSVLHVVGDVFSIISVSQGIFVFVIFVCNRQIYNKIKKKLGISDIGSCTTAQAVATLPDRSDINTEQSYTTKL